MSDPKTNITDNNQNMPETSRMAFLHGVLDEANTQGYSKHAAGRLFVLALRAWERK